MLLAGVRRRRRRRLHRARRARRSAPVARRDRSARGAPWPRVRAADPVRGGRALPRRDRPAARDERAHRIRRSAVHRRGARQGARRARKAIDATGVAVEIEIDGGIKAGNAALATEAGVDILVSGTGIFGAEDPAAAARAIRAAALVILRAKVLTVSDGVADGTREDKSGRALEERLVAAGYEVVDAPRRVPTASKRWPARLARDGGRVRGLILTTGGTGFGPRTSRPREPERSSNGKPRASWRRSGG